MLSGAGMPGMRLGTAVIGFALVAHSVGCSPSGSRPVGPTPEDAASTSNTDAASPSTRTPRPRTLHPRTARPRTPHPQTLHPRTPRPRTPHPRTPHPRTPRPQSFLQALRSPSWRSSAAPGCVHTCPTAVTAPRSSSTGGHDPQHPVPVCAFRRRHLSLHAVVGRHGGLHRRRLHTGRLRNPRPWALRAAPRTPSSKPMSRATKARTSIYIRGDTISSGPARTMSGGCSATVRWAAWVPARCTRWSASTLRPSSARPSATRATRARSPPKR